MNRKDQCGQRDYKERSPCYYKGIRGNLRGLDRTCASGIRLHTSTNVEDPTEEDDYSEEHTDYTDKTDKPCVPRFQFDVSRSLVMSAAFSKLSHLFFPSIPIPALSAGVWPSNAAWG